MVLFKQTDLVVHVRHSSSMLARQLTWQLYGQIFVTPLRDTCGGRSPLKRFPGLNGHRLSAFLISSDFRAVQKRARKARIAAAGV